MAIEKTYNMIKPDGVRNGHIGEIIARFERAGLTIERMELGMVTPEQAKAMASISDGAIVGSAIVKIIAKYGKDAAPYIGEYVKSMKEAVAE